MTTRSLPALSRDGFRKWVPWLAPLSDDELSWSRRERSVLATILIAAAAARLAAAAILESPLESDYLSYWTHANNLHGGRGLIDEHGAPTAFHSIGYPIFLAAMFQVFGAGIATVKIANVGLSVASILLLYLAARRAFHSVAVALLAAALYAAYVEGVVYTAYVAKENLMIFLLASLFYLSTLPLASTRMVCLAASGFGIAAGALAVVGNAGLAMAPGLLLLVLMNTRRVRDVLLYGATLVAFALLTVSPVLLRNQQAFGAAVLNNNGGFNLYIGNNPHSTPYFQSITETPLGTDWDRFRAEQGERGADAILRKQAMRHMLANPAATMELMTRKGVAFWWPPTHAGQYAAGSAERLVRLLWLTQYSLLVGVFLASLFYLRRHPAPVGAIWLTVLGYTFVHMIFYVVYRYRLPIMPFICVGAALPLAALLRDVWTLRSRGP
jgi:4-amino-4-deoxy-L-arabinose transferase-like glycosyltransferase